MRWTTRPETLADIDAIREVNAAAFPTRIEAGIVDALRADAGAWIPELSVVAIDEAGLVAGHALFSRCHIDGEPALALGPVAVRPERQRQGAGSAAIRAGLVEAKAMGEQTVVVLGHPSYYPRFGFARASRWGIVAPFAAPDEALMVLPLDATAPIPNGVIAYAAAFGVESEQ